MSVNQSKRLTGAICVTGLSLVVAGLLVTLRQPVQATDAAGVKLAASASSTAAQTKGKKPVPVVTTSTAFATSESADRTPVSTVGRKETTPVVTITGCLEKNDDSYRLKETVGTEAPKARSWKSGFLKKGTANVEVVDATNNRLRLQNHVGKRVSLTGTLKDREMRARSVQLVAKNCN
jgi:hypothetical protein